jgi:hypothetical protein
MLLSTKEIPLTPNVEVGTSDPESVVGLAEHGKSLPGLLSRLSYEDADGLGVTPSNPTAKLMELTEPEPLRMLNHHHGSIRHINPHFDH